MKWDDLPAELRDNPIFEILRSPQNLIAYDYIEPGHIKPAFDRVFEHLEEKVESLRKDKRKPSVKNTIDEIDYIQGVLDSFYAIFYVVQTHPKHHEALQKLDTEVDSRVKGFESELYTDDVLFERVKNVFNARKKMRLSQARRLAVESCYEEFIDAGAQLRPSRKALLKQIEKRKAELSSEIEDNAVFEFAGEVYVPARGDVSGIPKDVLARAKKHAQEESKGRRKGWLFDYDDQEAILKYAHNRDLRHKMWSRFRDKDVRANEDTPLVLKKIHELLGLQFEEARLKGFRSFAEQEYKKLSLESPKETKSFLSILHDSALDSASWEHEALLEFACHIDGVTELLSWDIEYYKNLFRADKVGFEPEDLKEYFAFEPTLEASLEEISEIWGVQIVENTSYYRVDPSVKMYDVYDTSGYKYRGVLTIDAYKYEGKEDGVPYCAAISSPYKGAAQDVASAALVHFYYDKPKGGKPCLIAPDEISDVIFHELGHAMHVLLNDQDYALNGSFECATDAVEIPSMVSEYWGRTSAFLTKVAKHYKTGESLHEEVIDAYLESRKFLAGMTLLERIRWSVLDIEWHNSNPNNLPSLVEFEQKVQERHRVIAWDGESESLDFTHIFGGGYDAVYSGYMIAEARAAQIFQKFRAEGLHNHRRLHQLRKAAAAGKYFTLTKEFNALARGALKSRAMLDDRGMLSDSFDYASQPSEVVAEFIKQQDTLYKRSGLAERHSYYDAENDNGEQVLDQKPRLRL